MPLANAFLRPEDVPGEYFFELAAGLCEACGLVQLCEQPEPQRMFHDAYPFYTGSSSAMTRHFEALAERVMRDVLPARDPLVVEIGSNDGTLLLPFARRGVRHAGFEPSANVAEVARSRGVHSRVEFFGEESADGLASEQGQADVILAANALCHIPDPRSVAAGVGRLLKPDGLLIFEDPYVGDMVSKTAYDQIYDEHVFLFSVTSVANLFAPFGLRLVDVEPLSTHGGSLRYTIARSGRAAPSSAVESWLAKERAQGLDALPAYHAFREACERSRDALVRLLCGLRSAGRTVAGYAATSKSTTLLNYCGIGPELVEFICDTTPLKQGRLTPGSHIPVLPHADFAARRPDYAFLLAWNHRDEILARERAFTEAGGRWIVHVPRVEVLA
jgi:methylation protein EvaC